MAVGRRQAVVLAGSGAGAATAASASVGKLPAAGAEMTTPCAHTEAGDGCVVDDRAAFRLDAGGVAGDRAARGPLRIATTSSTGVKSGAARGDVLHLRDVVGCEDELAR